MRVHLGVSMGIHDFMIVAAIVVLLLIAAGVYLSYRFNRY